MIAIAIHAASTRSREKKCHDQIRSTFEKNLSAAATSKKPITTFTLFIQVPERGSDFIKFGKRANRKNGAAKMLAKTTIPISGTNHDPRENATISVPTNGTVQLKLVREKTNPMSTTENILFFECCAVEFNFERIDEGTPISNSPKRLSAKAMKIAAMSRFSHEFAANS